MWMMDSSIAYGTIPEDSESQKTYAPLPEFARSGAFLVEDEPSTEEIMKKILFVSLHPIKATMQFFSVLSKKDADETASPAVDNGNSYAHASDNTVAFRQSEEIAHPAQNPENELMNPSKPVGLYAVIGVLSLIIIVGRVSFVRYVRANQTSQEMPVSSIADIPGMQNQLAEIPAPETDASVSEIVQEVPVTETPVMLSNVVQHEPIILSSKMGTSNEKYILIFIRFYRTATLPAVICMMLTMMVRMI